MDGIGIALVQRQGVAGRGIETKSDAGIGIALVRRQGVAGRGA